MSDGDTQILPDINVCETVAMIVSAVVADEIPFSLGRLNSTSSTNGEVTAQIVDVNELVELMGENGEEAATSLVNIQLDILNQRNESINKLEMEYEEQLRAYTSMVHEANSELNRIERKLGECVRTSFPYYHAMDDMMSAKENLDKFLDMFKQVQSYLLAIHDFREHFTHGRGEYEISDVWTKVADKVDQKASALRAKKSVLDSDIQKWSDAISSIKLTVKDVEAGIHKQIRKARPFYDKRYALRKQVTSQEKLLSEMKTCIVEVKAEYQDALRKLEVISNEIHRHRSVSGTSGSTTRTGD